MEEGEQVIVCIDGTQAHHWDIDTSNGTVSKGTCRKCERVKKFTNSMGSFTSNWRARGQYTYSSKIAGKDKNE